MNDLISKIESYGFECEAGLLSNCTDWHSLRQQLAEQKADLDSALRISEGRAKQRDEVMIYNQELRAQLDICIKGLTELARGDVGYPAKSRRTIAETTLSAVRAREENNDEKANSRFSSWENVGRCR